MSLCFQSVKFLKLYPRFFVFQVSNSFDKAELWQVEVEMAAERTVVEVEAGLQIEAEEVCI